MNADALPPHRPDAERAAIGCALQEPALAADLRLDWFYDLRHRAVVEQLLAFAQAGQIIAPSTLAAALAGSGLEDSTALVAECDAACHSPAHWPFWREQLQDALTLRRVLQTAYQATVQVREGPPVADVLATFEREALAIRLGTGPAGAEECDLRATLLELTIDYEQALTAGRPAGLATGLYDLDQILGGLKPGQLVVVAGRPGEGKTALALTIVERVAVDDRLPVGLFSLEMSGKEVLHRLACARARIDGIALNQGRVTTRDLEALTRAHAKLVKAPLHLCDRGGLTLAQLAAGARRMVQRHGIRLLVVDYLGLLRSGEKGRSRYEETTLISNGAKALAKELALPVLLLAQLNRANDRENRAPRLSDLRDSGAIEQDADIVALLHRHEDQSGTEPRVSLIIAKQRNGRTGKVDLLFRRQWTRFDNLAKGEG